MIESLSWLWEWALKNVLTFSVGYQILFLGASLFGAYFSSEYITDKIKLNSQFFRYHSRLNRGVFYLSSLLCLWVSIIILSLFGLDPILLHKVSILLVAWIIVSALSFVLGSTYGIQVLAIFIWVVAALSVFELLPKVISFFQKLNLDLNGHKISIWILIKGVLTISALMIGANFFLYLLRTHLSQRPNVPLTQRVLILKFTRVFLFIFVVLVGLHFTGIDITALAFMGGAIGVGLGFGLQKIFSNLVSGFILLMDESIKPGDIIAVKDTYGVVKKLRARYVSIVTRDGKKHLIPNDTLITEPVENWSYQDDKIRIHIPVGISYDNDPHEAKKLILEAAEGVDRILKNPEPICLIRRFGDSAVEMELRAWVDDPQNGVENIVSSACFLILDKFKKHGIHIPYPQRQLHIQGQGKGVSIHKENTNA